MLRNYDDPQYKKWRLSIYKRDKFKCQWPGCVASKKLNAHHIKRWADCPGLRYDVNNGITLCKDHHKSINGIETYYESIFLKIVANNNDNNRS